MSTPSAEADGFLGHGVQRFRCAPLARSGRGKRSRKNIPCSVYDITVNYSASDDVPQVYGSEGQIDQALVNLFMNARDAMGESGRIDITVDVAANVPGYALGNTGGRAERYIRVRFADTGSGIPEEHLPHVFEPFYTTKNNGKLGSGLGLSTVYNIIKEHNGSISVSSAVGAGTTFDLYFPAIDQNASILYEP